MTAVSNGSSPLLSVSGLSVELAGRQVLHDVSFDIARGEAFALVGESGSGKTVTARVVTGLLDNIGGRILGGKVTFDGVELGQADTPERQKLRGSRIALVPQASLSSLNPVVRIGKQISETVRFLDPQTDHRARSLELLEQVQLPRPKALLKAYPHELSGGMRQRVMIALALAGRPELIVADEPTTALDVTVQAGILSLIRELKEETGMTLMLIAHDLAVVNMVTDSVAVMRQGRLIESGSTEAVLTAPSHPYTRAMLAARPEATPAGQTLTVLDRETGELRKPEQPEARDVTPDVLMTVQSVSVTYPGADAPSLAPISLDIRAGKSIGIVGESGSGKTTLGRVLVGALRPTTGDIRLDGQNLADVNWRHPARRSVQMIFQDPYGSLTPWRTPRQAVAEVFLRWDKLPKRAALRKAGELLHEVGLPEEAMDKSPSKLSGGQCQRVGIARALASEPKILVADEPTSSLDISSQAQILNLLMGLRASRGLSLVVISHDLSVIRHMADTAIVMKNGEVVEANTTELLFTSPEADYTRQLVASTPTLSDVQASM
ncbi:dipeptide ABC transporter ATP-binding protein [Pseudarthrobacter sulfonivorans]|uniref:dipeptide ABC transporter ATP-binding protein n=1 Tax=Pseudarthrobacter sulfonivorans TaxID=121292 RepID=UPI00210646F1|nr:ABC transporter ATP-binding protein [Pseudarthrobacter sulfonivorans]